MKKYLVLLVVLFLLGGCAISKTPVTNRTQLILISSEQELALGEQSFKQTLQEMKISNDLSQTKRVEDIGKRLASVAQRDDFKWEFALVENDQVNAFCLPGGKIVVYTGIFKVAKSDGALATVISHEIGHAIARHGAERMSLGLVSSAIQVAANVALATSHPESLQTFNIAYGLGANYGVILPYSRMQEFEADQIGVDLMHKAGFNIDEALIFWNDMKKLSSGKSVPAFASTHPSDEARISNLYKVIQGYKNK
ncbi:M48 family metallopeptidase [Arcobacter sp. FWKO B]|uniref:M48 family metallopeptidase n=1 Tax=Arcobacter sp. FWKO B TaxID=2593672 RepID=UPI0018A46B92|nr:M48 family metallopeptidase [Arcobacter sp. FWKO B]QOG11311.1 M48 family metallopeptidase [Arcobacter sp. FWKO B]